MDTLKAILAAYLLVVIVWTFLVTLFLVILMSKACGPCPHCGRRHAKEDVAPDGDRGPGPAVR